MNEMQRNKFQLKRRLFLMGGARAIVTMPAVLAAASLMQACTKKEEPEMAEEAAPGAAGGESSPEPAPTDPTQPDENPQFITEIPSAKTLVTSLKYVAESTTPGQNCTNCQFYTAQAGVAGGKCTLFPMGYVHANGWCASWTQKSA